jgi:large subunit ribosomal protein L10
MNREQKAAVVEEVAAQIKESEAVFAVDYRGISVPEAAVLRERLGEAGARFRVVKNTLTQRAADKAGAEALKEVLEGPTAFTFVAPENGDVALAAKALSQFSRERNLLEFKGGVMNGEPLTAEQIAEIARLPAKDVLQGQVVGVIASPITGLVRGLNALIAGLAVALKQIADEGKVPVSGAAAEGAPQPAAEQPATEAAAEEAGEGAAPEQPTGAAAGAPGEAASEAPEDTPAETEQAAQAGEAAEEAAQSAEGKETESSTEAESSPPAEPAPASEESHVGGEKADASDTPSEGENE